MPAWSACNTRAATTWTAGAPTPAAARDYRRRLHAGTSAGRELRRSRSRRLSGMTSMSRTSRSAGRMQGPGTPRLTACVREQLSQHRPEGTAARCVAGDTGDDDHSCYRSGRWFASPWRGQRCDAPAHSAGRHARPRGALVTTPRNACRSLSKAWSTDGRTGKQTARAEWQGQRCVFEFERPAQGDPQPDLGDVTCRPETVTATASR